LKNKNTNRWCKRKITTIFSLAVLFLVFGGNCFAAEYVKLKMYPEHVGVFTSDGEQQYVVFGYMSDGSSTNLTSKVNWESSNENIITIDDNGLATIVDSVTRGQVTVSCSYPKTGKSLSAVNLLLLSGPKTYTVGGSVTGLDAGNSVVMQNNSGDDLSVNADGSFTFATPLETGDDYAVTVLTDPTSPNQTCVVSNGSGTISDTDVTDVTVVCTTTTYTVGGDASGLATDNIVVLQNNSADDLPVNANGSFTFATPIDDGTGYDVTVLTEPTTPSQTCVVENGSGLLAGDNVTDVTVICTTNQYSVGGVVSGLDGTVVLKINDGETRTVSVDGNYVFPTSLEDETPYEVIVETQPAGQTCDVANHTGILEGADVSDVNVTCSDDI